MVLALDVADGVAVVTLNRPEARNALDSELITALDTTMSELDARDDVAAIVITGADPAFCAGLDLKELGGTGENLRGGTASGRPWARTRKPVVGAVNGPAITGGLELALQCDFLVASPRARFADTHARVGILPGWGLTVLLPQAVGIRKAREMSFTGNFVDAEEALALGLVNRLVDHDRLLDETRRLALDIAGNDGATVQAFRASYERIVGLTTEEGFRRESQAQREFNVGFDPAEVARRRAAIVDRGRAQASDASGT
ncbi:MAG TPA: enoyl-CoA hydratase [Acidimicrobiales bacterium]|nr:enoyl-CoA hydratase [Acidimicrobiales bacterium]